MIAILAATTAQGGEEYSIAKTVTVCALLLVIVWALGTAGRDSKDRRPGIDPRKLQESIDAHPSAQPAKHDSDR